MNDTTNLLKELDAKIQNQFKDNQAYLNYLLQTKQNFLHRYLETTNDKNIKIKNIDAHTLIATSLESNMGEAFKMSDKEIKEAIKNLAKKIPKENNPQVLYSLKTVLRDFTSEKGLIEIEAKVNWGFPNFIDEENNFKAKKVIFEFVDPHVFRKELALKYEEACDLFN